jgi:hypothetical protein
MIHTTLPPTASLALLLLALLLELMSLARASMQHIHTRPTADHLDASGRSVTQRHSPTAIGRPACSTGAAASAAAAAAADLSVVTVSTAT